MIVLLIAALLVCAMGLYCHKKISTARQTEEAPEFNKLKKDLVTSYCYTSGLGIFFTIIGVFSNSASGICVLIAFYALIVLIYDIENIENAIVSLIKKFRGHNSPKVTP